MRCLIVAFVLLSACGDDPMGGLPGAIEITNLGNATAVVRVIDGSAVVYEATFPGGARSCGVPQVVGFASIHVFLPDTTIIFDQVAFPVNRTQVVTIEDESSASL